MGRSYYQIGDCVVISDAAVFFPHAVFTVSYSGGKYLLAVLLTASKTLINIRLFVESEVGLCQIPDCVKG